MLITIVAEQHRADHGLLVGEQLVHPLGAPVAVALQLVHAPAAGAGQGGLGGREHRRHRQQEQHEDRQRGPDAAIMAAAPSVDEEFARPAAASTSLATNASPMRAGQDEGQRARPRPSCPAPCGRSARSARERPPGTSVEPGRQAGGGDGAARRAAASWPADRGPSGREAEGQGAAQRHRLAMLQGLAVTRSRPPAHGRRCGRG